jgi:hypothetical protein
LNYGFQGYIVTYKNKKTAGARTPDGKQSIGPPKGDQPQGFFIRITRRATNSRAGYFFWFDDVTARTKLANVTANINASKTVIRTTPFRPGMADHP